jgi:hypothetical protein
MLKMQQFLELKKHKNIHDYEKILISGSTDIIIIIITI